MLCVRPQTIIIVCGLYYDHDNVVRAVSSICDAFLKETRILLYVQNDFAPTSKVDHKSFWLECLSFAGKFLIAAFLILLSPIVKIRAAEIFSLRIGHLAYDCEIYLCERELGFHRKFFDIFYLKDGQVCNKTLLRLFSRQMRITSLARLVYESALLFGLKQHLFHLVTRHLGTARDSKCLIPATSPHIAFTAQERRCASLEMAKLGMESGKPYVCLLGRDAAYLQSIKPFLNDGNLQEPRNMDIKDYIPTATCLTDFGYTVLRMGSLVKEPLAVNNPAVIDYARHPGRSDFMDVYLSATCRFFIGSGSGLQEVPVIFRTPCLLINCFQLELLQACSSQNILLPQLLFDRQKGRYLRVDEILASGLGRWGVEQFARSEHIVLVPNTPREIQEAALEMHQRLEGAWRTPPGHDARQARFWSNFKPSAYNACFAANIGSVFLQRHADTLF